MEKELREELRALLTYPYQWSPSSDSTVEEYVSKYKPSMIQDDGTKPWLWVNNIHKPDFDAEKEAAAEEEATKALEETAKRVEEIQNDDAIPLRSNKKKGTRSKKELRDEATSQASSRLKEIALKYNHTTGKWLIYAKPDLIDAIWSKLAVSVASGPLSSTPVFSAKVSTSPKNDAGPNYQHVICVYLPNIYDESAAREVLRILVREHSTPSAAKPDLYTGIGLDSKHRSGVRSTVWQPKELIDEKELKEMRDAFFASLKAGTDTAGGTSKGPLKPKATDKKDDPFGSDSEDEDEGDKKAAKEKEVQRRQALLKSKAPPAGSSKTAPKKQEEFSTTEEEDEAPKKVAPKRKAKAAPRVTKRAKTKAVSDEDDD
ncbi:hypothetical protein BOTBODRAFT_27407 [Botryobasidium botryosum FD-172 SS1]|uniref:Uncharacterized protein n=1 Tax=Botryobasidium botryosum (strain FD-172 SS1) TaxID=930990 RepID=A0A067MZ67_BOTB1|nr:hypothetical protein BOTBODRAFT_27407 [Botryobasidium botryosum FD-172 SS1]